MTKCLFTVCVDNYAPEVCAKTFPLMQQYAERIGADFKIITERKFKNFPPNFEKFQIFELGEEYDFNILADADLFLFEGLHDVTDRVPLANVGSMSVYGAHFYFKKLDKYFLRDSRDLAIVTNFVVTTRFTHEAWEPPKLDEDLSGFCHNKWCQDEFAFSRNVAKYGLKYSGIIDENEKNVRHLSLTTR